MINDNKKNGSNSEISAQQTQPIHKGTNKLAILLGAVLAIVVVAGVVYFQNTQSLHNDEIKQYQLEQMSLNHELVTRDSLIDDWVSALAIIQNDLKTLHSKEESLKKQTVGPELSNNVRENILAEIQQINALLEKNKAKINDLNKRLRNSGIKIASLEQQIATLQISLNKSDSMVEELKMDLVNRDFQLAELNVAVDSLSNSLVEAEGIISARDAELNKGFIASGSYDELEGKGLIHKEGGFLGLGKSKELNANLPIDAFQEIDINQTRRIALNAKSINLISDHPESSYELVESDSLNSYIEITNPDEFWRISRYAVLETSL